MAWNCRQAVEGSAELVIVDHGVNRHCYGLHADSKLFDQDIHTIHASEADPVTIHQIAELFENIQTQFYQLEQNRSYSWQGINCDEGNGIWTIRWGS